MYIILSNNGPWDFDSVGVVGGIECVSEFVSWVRREHMKDLLSSEDVKIELIFSGFNDILEENELSIYSAGETILAACVSEKDCFPSVYFLQKFN